MQARFTPPQKSPLTIVKTRLEETFLQVDVRLRKFPTWDRAQQGVSLDTVVNHDSQSWFNVLF